MAHSLASDSMHPGGKLPPTLTPTGHFAGKPTLPISRSVTLIGARKQARLQLISSTVSQNHALIVNADSGPYIRDLASREHVFVNGIEVREGALADGDEIQVGRFTFRFNESPHTQPIEAVRDIKGAPAGHIEINGVDQPYPFNGKSILVGRRDLCEISLMEDSASTTHAIFFEMDGRRYLRDLASRTGTFVNGRQIHQVELHSGDEIKIGETTMRYSADGAPTSATEELRASTGAAAAPVGDLSVEADDLVDLEPAPAPPPPARPTPQPKAPAARKGPVAPPPVPTAPPEGADALELVQDQPAETEDVELTPADLEVELEPLGMEPAASSPAAIPLDSETQPEHDEVELEPLHVAPADELEIHDDHGQSDEVDDLIDLIPQAEPPAEPAPGDTNEIQLEPVESVQEHEEPPAKAPSVQEQVELQPLHFSYDGMEPVAEEEVELEPAAVEPAAEPEPAPVPVDEIDVAPAEPPHAEPTPVPVEEVEAAPEPIHIEPEAEVEPEPVAEEPAPVEEEEFREVRARADELTLDSISPIPTSLPPSKLGPGASQLDLEPVSDIEADDFDEEEPAETEAEAEAEAEPEAEAPEESEPEIEPAPAVAEESPVEPTPEPEPIASADSEDSLVEEEPAQEEPAEEQPDAAVAELDNEIGISPRLAEMTTDHLPDDLPELDVDSVVMEFPPIDESEIAQLDFGAPAEVGEPLGLGQDAFAVRDEPATALPLDLGAANDEPIPDFTLPPVSADDFKLDLDLSDTIVGEQTPVFEMPPMPAPAKKKPAPKAPKPAAKVAPPAPVAPPPPVQKPTAPPVAKAPPAEKPAVKAPPPAPVAKAPPRPPVPAPPKVEAPPVVAPPPPSAPKLVQPSKPVAKTPPPPPVVEAPPVEPPRQKIEVLEPTESTPESALELEQAIAESEAPAVPEKAIEVELTDSSFGRAVESFVGESTTGPIVEQPVAKAPPAPPAPPPPAPVETTALELPDELELELVPVEVPAVAPPPPKPPAPIAAKPVVVEPPPVTDEDGAFDLLEAPEAAPVPPTPVKEDKLFDLPLTSASSAMPAAGMDELELQLEPLPVIDEVPAAKPQPAPPPPTPKPIAVTPPPAPAPLEIEEVESPAETIELELSEDVPPAKPARPSPGGLALDEPPAVGAGAADDEVSDWGLELEVEEAEAPTATGAPTRPAEAGPAAGAPVRPITPQPVVEAPRPVVPTPPSAPPVAPAAPGMDAFNWGANQDHFLGGMPLQLSPGNRVPAPEPSTPSARAPMSTPPPIPAEPPSVVPHAPVRPTQQSRVLDEPPPAPPAPPTPVAEPIRPATPIPPLPPQQPQRAPAPPPPRQTGPRNPLAAEPTPPRQKSQVSTGFDGLALPVNETDVFGGLASGLGAFDQAPVDDVFARRPSPVPQPPSGQQQPPAARPPQRRSGPARPAGDPWAPQNVAPPPPTKPPHLGELPSNGGGDAGSSSGLGDTDDISEIVLDDIADDGSASETPTPAAPPPPPRKKRRWFGLKSLLFLMILLMAGAAGGIWKTMPSKSSVTAQLQFANFGALPLQQRKTLEGDQRKYLAEDSLRVNARSKVIANRGHIEPGFIDKPSEYARTVSLAQLNMESGIFTIPFVGGASMEDQTRMMALVQALYDANSKLIAEANDTNRTVASLTREREEAQKSIDAMGKQIEDLGQVAANGPTAGDRAKLEADAATLEQTYKATLANVTELSEKLKQLRENPAAVAAAQAATQPTGNDAVLQQLQGDLKTLTDRVAAAQDDKSDKAAAARKKLDEALAAFNQQIAQAQGAVKNNPELLAYVDNAQKLMGSSRELIDSLIKRQQEQFAQLTDLKAKLNDKMLARRGELWKKDKELVNLMDRQDITNRQYNAAVGAGLTQQASDKKAELTLLDSQIKARQTLVADDGFYADAIDQLQKIIDTTQKGLEDDRRLTNQRLDEMQATFTASQPAMEKLTPDQKALAEQMSKRLDEVTAARRQYTEAAAAANQQANEEMQNLQASASDLENKVQARKKQLIDASPATPAVPPAAPSAAEQKLAIDKLASQLATAEKARSDAEAAYFAANKNLLAIKDKIEQSRKAGEDRDKLTRERDRVSQDLDAKINQYDQWKKLAEQKTYPLVPTPADIKVDKKDDKRPMYTLFAWGGIFAFFMLMLLLTGTGGDNTPVPTQPPFLPDAGYETESENGHETYAQLSDQQRKRNTPVEV